MAASNGNVAQEAQVSIKVSGFWFWNEGEFERDGDTIEWQNVSIELEGREPVKLSIAVDDAPKVASFCQAGVFTTGEFLVTPRRGGKFKFLDTVAARRFQRAFTEIKD